MKAGVLLLIPALAGLCSAQPGATYRIPKALEPLSIDARLDESVWQGALKLELKYETSPGENTPAAVKTECLLLYDDSSLYIGFRAFDPKPSEIRARLNDRDGSLRDDSVGFSLDTFNDQRRSFEFDINPLGVQGDSFNGDSSWDAIWNSAGRITDTGYEVEAAIPFSSLRFPKTEGDQTWGLLVYRYYPRSTGYEISLTPVDRNDTCLLCREAKLVGLTGITPGHNLELTPTFTSHRSDERDPFPDGPLTGKGFESQAGLSARWGITSSLNLNAAVNPDFSQVEADPLLVDINTRFALYYAEKRPFFLEGADFFGTPLTVVHTRSVADPDWGIKLTGKEQKNAVGLFAARDKFTNLLFPSNQGSASDFLDQPSTASVLRYRRDILQDSTLGLLLTDRQGADYYNRVLGFDGNVRLSQSDTIDFQLLGSQTLYPAGIADANGQPASAFGGGSLFLDYYHDARNWNWWGAYVDLGTDFRSDLGFIPQVDIRDSSAGLGYTIYGNESQWFTRIDLSAGGVHTENHAGVLTDQGYSFFAVVTGPQQSRITARFFSDKELFEDRYYINRGRRFSFSIVPRGEMTLAFIAYWAGAIDFANARPARLLMLNPSVRFTPGRHFKMTINHTYQRLNEEAGRLFDIQLTDGNLQYQFNTRALIRAILQYSSVHRHPELYAFPVPAISRKLFTQILLSYTVTPRTLMYLGYSDNHRGLERLDLTQTDRTIFLKLSYNWLL